MLRWKIILEEQSCTKVTFQHELSETESSAGDEFETESPAVGTESVTVAEDHEERLANTIAQPAPAQLSKTKTSSWVLAEPYESKWWCKQKGKSDNQELDMDVDLADDTIAQRSKTTSWVLAEPHKSKWWFKQKGKSKKKKNRRNRRQKDKEKIKPSKAPTIK